MWIPVEQLKNRVSWMIEGKEDMHRVLFPEFQLDGKLGGRDLTKLFQTTTSSSHADNDGSEERASVFGKHRIRRFGAAAPLDRGAAENGSHESSTSAKQLLNSELSLLKATIQNQEMLLIEERQQMHELRLKNDRQNAENRSLKNQVIEMKEAASRIAEQHAVEIQSYLTKVMDAEEKSLQASSAMELAASVHKAATGAQRAATSARYQNSAFKRDKDRLIHLLSLFEPAKALASQLQQIPSHYFPLPGIGSSAISSITRAQLTSASSFVKPFVSKKLTAESSFWMSSKIANTVLSWGTENNIDESTLMELVAQLHKMWTDTTKRAKELTSVSRLRKSRTASCTPRDLSTTDDRNESQSFASKKDNWLQNDIRTNISHSSQSPFQQKTELSLNSWGELLESGMSRMRMKSHSERKDSSLNSRANHHPESDLLHMPPPSFQDHHIISPLAIRSLCKSEERSRQTRDVESLDLIESLKQEMLFMGDLSAEKRSPMPPQSSLHKEPFEKCDLTLRNTILRISLINE
jgi:hypothetical protein